MTNIFNSKEEYQAIRSQWKKIYADGRHKAIKHPYIGLRYENRKYVQVPGYHMISPLTFHHHLIYLAATGKSLEKATPKMHKATIYETYLSLSWITSRYRIQPELMTAQYLEGWIGLFDGKIDPQYLPAIFQRLYDYFEALQNA